MKKTENESAARRTPGSLRSAHKKQERNMADVKIQTAQSGLKVNV